MRDGDTYHRIRRSLARLQSNQETNQAFENRPIPSGFVVPEVDTFMLTDALVSMVETLAEREEDIYRRAILGTDWSETTVLRIIAHYPIPPVSSPGDYEFDGPEYEIERYDDRAPPVSDHADGDRRCSVATITWPLLEQLREEHDDVAEIVDVALSPEEGSRV